MNKEILQAIPSVQELIIEFSPWQEKIDERYLKKVVQEVIASIREEILQGGISRKEDVVPKLRERITHRLESLTTLRMKRVINGTGIILHTNLGRAPLAENARQHLRDIIENYNNLEIELDTGKRGNRISIVEERLCLITGAEEALIVNNNAAAIFLALNSLCLGKEVPVSRGELVEIGGSFRMPEVMKASGAIMVEVGTTNKTHLKDYQEAINPNTGAILKVHTSNYRVLGFTKSVPIRELVELAHSRGLPVVYDMGSGVIEDLQNWGYPHEPVAREYVEAGVDVITFSGDKILGGPQAGVIIGKSEYIQKIKKNHLLRALRCDKLTYSLMDATLQLYLKPQELPRTLPVAYMLNLSQEELRKRGEKLAQQIRSPQLEVQVEDTFSQMGSGALPLEKIPSVGLRMIPRNISLMRFARKLRLGEPAVVGYIEDEAFWINLRTVREDELELVARAVNTVMNNT